MPLTPQEQRELEELEFERLNAEKAAAAKPRRQLATSELDRDRELLRTESGRKELEARAAAGEPKARGNIGLLADIALEGGGATAGQAVGALAGPVGIPVGGAVGGVLGNLASQKRRILAGEQPTYRVGEALSSALTGAIPGAPLAARGGRAVAKEVFKQGVGGVVGKGIETGVDEGRIPSIPEAAVTFGLPAVAGSVAHNVQLANPEIRTAADAALAGIGSTKRTSFEAGKEAGYWVPPSEVTGSWVNKRLESLAGPADVRRGAALHNQEVTNRLAAAELGLPEGTEITRPVLQAVRDEAGIPYRELSAVSPAAADDLQALRDARDEIRVHRKDYNTNARAESLRQARNAEALAATLEAQLENAAVAAGRPDLVDAMRAARTRIAKTWDVENALNVGDSGVSAPILGRAIDRGKPLTENLATIANFAEAFPRVIPEAARVHPFGLSKTEAITGSALAGLGFGSTHDPRALALALVPPILSSTARRTVLSRPYQALVANMEPPTVVGVAPDSRAMATRAVTQEAAQEVAEELKPETKAADPERKVVKAEEEIPTLTPEEFKKFKGGKFRTVNGTLYEKLPDGTKRKL